MAPSTMRAAVLEERGKGFVVKEIPVPIPGPRDLLIKVTAASLCRSEISIMEAEFGYDKLPLIPGHEAIGVVAEVGSAAASYGFQVGDVVGAVCWYGSCTECAPCKKVGIQYCPYTGLTGMTRGGYFAEYCLNDAAYTVKVESEVAHRILAPIFCAGVTVYEAITRAGVTKGTSVAIVGAGGLGQQAIPYVSAMGASPVIALDVLDPQLEAVHGKGLADEVINVTKFSTAAIAGTVSKLCGGLGVDVVIVTSAAVPAYNTAQAIVRPQGQIIVVGLPHEPIPVPPLSISSRCYSMVGSKVPGAKGAKECLDFVLKNKLFPKINARKFELEDLNEMIALMKAGKVEEGRMVVEFPN